MPKTSNQQIERYYFDMFRNHYSLPDGIVEYADKPDVILRGDRRIGIEITNFFLQEGALPESEQVQRRARQAVVSTAQRLYEAKTNRKFEFTFGFDSGTPIRNQKKLARAVADLACQVDGSETGELNRELFADIPEVEFAYLNRNEYKDVRWQVTQVFSVPVMSFERLKEIIKIKEAKSRDYRACDAYWLLLVVDFMDRAQDQEIEIDRTEVVISRIFEKVIVYKTVWGQVLEMNFSR